MHNIDAVLAAVTKAVKEMPETVDDRGYFRVYNDLKDIERQLVFMVKREREDADPEKQERA